MLKTILKYLLQSIAVTFAMFALLVLFLLIYNNFGWA